jgi:Zn-dependent protease with chaperone function
MTAVPAAATGTATPPGSVRVERWPTETPLFVLVVLAAVALWLLLALTIFGLLYVALIGLALFFAHVVLVTHIRGSAVRLGPDQFPELHERVLELAHQAGIDPVPEAYLMEAGGSLNAFATRFLRSRMIVLYSDLLEACEGDEAARDMVIGHELGHIKAGHLRFVWVLAPGLLMPFLGSAYSRACEYTCDRWGSALCGDSGGAVRGLAVLAAGGRLARRVNLRSFVRQSSQLDTGWMTVGKWLSRYPPLCDRVAALEPDLRESASGSMAGPVRAVLLLASVVVVPAFLFAGAFALFSLGMTALGGLLPDLESPTDELGLGGFDALDAEPPSFPAVEDVGAASAQVDRDFERLAALAAAYAATSGALPEEITELQVGWEEAYPGEPFPRDPFDGQHYGFDVSEDGRLFLLSSGPDGRPQTDDDITIERMLPAESAVASPEA